MQLVGVLTEVGDLGAVAERSLIRIKLRLGQQRAVVVEEVEVLLLRRSRGVGHLLQQAVVAVGEVIRRPEDVGDRPSLFDDQAVGEILPSCLTLLTKKAKVVARPEVVRIVSVCRRLAGS